MIKQDLKIKLEFIDGLKNIVLEEIKQFPELKIEQKNDNSIYLDFFDDFFLLHKLRSVQRVFIISKDPLYNPLYLARHKSIIGNIVSLIIKNANFKTFRIICAGSGTETIKSIASYIQDTFALSESLEADLKIHVIKRGRFWEVGAQTTPKPLSLRDYKERNMEGAMDPTIAFAVNSLSNLEHASTYLNIFSGSATLLIEAGQVAENLNQLTGFDNSKEALSLAIKNIKKAGLLKKISLKEADILNNPLMGKFDVITSDLPFGMLISKFIDLDQLYSAFIKYAEQSLNPSGTMTVYTAKTENFKKAIKDSNLKIVRRLDLKLITNSKISIYPSIFVCQLN